MQIADRYGEVRRQIDAAAVKAGRDPSAVTLLAVSKRQPAAAIGELAALEQRDFGENYVQEASAKLDALAHLDLRWHFIGQVQTNKTRDIAARFDWVHSVDRLKVARRLNVQRPQALPPLNVCVEVNLSGETSKGGLALDEIADFIDEIVLLPRLNVRGLMALPAPSESVDEQRSVFRRLALALNALQRPGLDTLSMGTSADFEAAIAEGATIVRVGTALFGPRRD